MKKTASRKHKEYFYTIVDSPIGKLRLVGSDDGLAAILWKNDNPHRVPLNIVAGAPNHPLLVETAHQLGEYFAGKRKVFDLTLDFVGTEFQRKVWEALLTIPFGETRSYGQIAKQIGRPDAVRAVGAANGRNPISIVAPCHRVIGSTGKLTGFAGGLPAKAHLLTLEGAHPESFAARSAMLWALSDGRALPAGELALERTAVPSRRRARHRVSRPVP